MRSAHSRRSMRSSTGSDFRVTSTSSSPLATSDGGGSTGSRIDEYRREKEPFFKSRLVNETIDRLAAAKVLTVYVGAGITIDQGGHTWSELVENMANDMQRRNIGSLSDIDARTLGQSLDPLEAASAIYSYFRQVQNRSSSDKVTTDAVINCLAHNLYPNPRWDQGEQIRAIGAVAMVRAACGYKTRIVTTNYDVLLEEAIRAQVKAFKTHRRKFGISGAAPEIKAWTLKQSIRESDGHVIDLIYLHGRIPHTQEEATRGRVAFTELDYAELRPAISDLLSTLFRSSSVLILGASLTDPPLLSALQETTTSGRSSGGAAYRAALLPIPAIQARARRHVGRDETIALRKHHVARMQSLAVDLLVPDFYSSVAQFCDELDCATYRYSLGPDGEAETQVPRYWPRLTNWWRDWYPYRFRNTQYMHVFDRYLKATMAEVARDVSAAKNVVEQFKLEVWAIWNPDDERRYLKRWASTSWPRSDWDNAQIDYLEQNARRAEIIRNSGYPAVDAFVSGCPKLTRLGAGDEADDSPRSSRWRTVLSVPILISAAHTQTAVGVVTWSSTSADSCLADDDPAFLDDCVWRMRRLGLFAFKNDRLAALVLNGPSQRR